MNSINKFIRERFLSKIAELSEQTRIENIVEDKLEDMATAHHLTNQYARVMQSINPNNYFHIGDLYDPHGIAQLLVESKFSGHPKLQNMPVATALRHIWTGREEEVENYLQQSINRPHELTPYLFK